MIANFGPYWVKRSAPIVGVDRVWAEPFVDDVYVRLAGGSLLDQQSTTTITQIPGSGGNNQNSGTGWGGRPGISLSPANGYLSFPNPAIGLDGSTALTLEARFKPADYDNWVICGPAGTDITIACYCEAGDIYFELPYGAGTVVINTLDYNLSSPTAIDPGGFWVLSCSIIFNTGTASYQAFIKLNGELYNSSWTVTPFTPTVGGTILLGKTDAKPGFSPSIILDEFRLSIGNCRYGSNTFNYFVNPVRMTNSSGLGLGWDPVTSTLYNGTTNPPPNLRFLDDNRTVIFDFDPVVTGPTIMGSQGFAVTRRTTGGKRFFEIILNRISQVTTFGIMAMPTDPPSQDSPYEDPGDYYLLEIYDGGSGSCGTYAGYSDPGSAIFDSFFAGTDPNDTFGFYVDLDANRVDKVVRNGVELDSAPLNSLRINTKTWTQGWNVIPYYNARPGVNGVSFTIITAGEFRFPPAGADSSYLPWD